MRSLEPLSAASGREPRLEGPRFDEPGPNEKLYLEGSEVEAIYPLSVVTAGMGINLTVISYSSKLCFAITSCPSEQPGIEKLGRYLKDAYADLRDAIDQEPPQAG